MPKSPSISAKNTKQEIWDAYQELLTELQTELPTTSLSKKFEITNTQLKNQLLTLTAEFDQTVKDKLNQLINQFDQAAQILNQLNRLHENQTQALAQEKTDSLKSLKREEEDQRYEFEKLKKRQTEELADQKQKVEAEFAVKRVELKTQEDELKELRQKVAAFAGELETAVKDAVEHTTQDLTREFNHQKILTEQQAQAREALLQQKVASIEATIKTQQVEISHLQLTLKENNQLLTRIAERAVEKGPSASSSSAKE